MNENGDSNITSDDYSVNEHVLIPVSFNLLYDGMIVRDDIYDFKREKMLTKAGISLSDDRIDRMFRMNDGRDTIYVTGRTKKTMVEKRPNIEIDIDSRTQLEESTGYNVALDKTLMALQNISRVNKLDSDELKDTAYQLSERIESTSPAVILSLINAMAPVDQYLQRHSVNVAMLCGLLGGWLGLPKEEIDKLILIGLLHDSGKALMPPAILKADRKITIVEYEVIKMHAVRTYELLDDFPEDVRKSASSHHERLDGSGYPKRLVGDEINLWARITAVADTYDAIVSRRTYKKPRSPFFVLSMFNKMIPGELDPDVVKTLAKNMPKELINKPVTMSDGTIGIVREFDPNDIEYPTIELSGGVIKTDRNLYCVSMFTEE